MANLEQLPTELVQIILSYVRPKNPKSNGDIESLSRVSKVLRALAEPFLYNSVRFRWYEGPPRQRLRAFHFLRTLVERAQLAAYVEHIHLTSGPAESVEHRSYRSRRNLDFASGPDFKRLYGAAAASPGPVKWVNDAVGVGMPASFALIIRQLLNLKSLRCELDVSWQKASNLGALHEQVFYNLSSRTEVSLPFETLAGLQQITYNPEGISIELVRMNGHRGEVFRLLNVPQLKELVLSGWSAIHPSTFSGPDVSSLRKLTLNRLRIRSDYVHSLLSACPCLESLIFGSGTDIQQHGCVHVKALAEALPSLNAPLKHLEYSHNFFSEPWDVDYPDHIDYRFLRRFSLEKLDLRMETLLEWNAASYLPISKILPESLVELAVKDDVNMPLDISEEVYMETYSSVCEATVASLLELVRSNMINPRGRLQRLTIKLTCFSRMRDRVEDLVKCCRGLGVDVRVEPRRSDQISERKWRALCARKAWWDHETFWDDFQDRYDSPVSSSESE